MYTKMEDAEAGKMAPWSVSTTASSGALGWSPQTSPAFHPSSRLPVVEANGTAPAEEQDTQVGTKASCAWRTTTGSVIFVALLCMSAVLNSISQASPPKLRIWNPDLRKEFSTEPLAKSVIRKFDAYNMARGGRDDRATFDANVNHYLAPDLFYESVGFGNWHTPAGWAAGEEAHYGAAFPETIFTQMLFFGDNKVSTTTTYGQALWSGKLFGMEPPMQWVNLRITDFYSIREERPGYGRVFYNFMMIDWADVLRQIGRPVLRPATLPEGLVLPPAANDGVPAPLSVIVQAEHRDEIAARKAMEKALSQDWAGEKGEIAKSWHENMTFYGPAGIGHATSREEYRKHILEPFRVAFQERHVEQILSACEGNYCSCLGKVHGTGVANWIGLPTKGKMVALRFGMHWRVVDGQPKEGWAIFDYPGLFEQLNMDFYAVAREGKKIDVGY